MTERLEHLARRVENDPFFLASALAEYARGELLDDAGLALALGCLPETLTRLRLCRRPQSSDPAAFGTDVERIAARFDMDPGILAQIVRRADALATWRDATASASERDDAGLLAAARDRDDQPPDEE